MPQTRKQRKKRNKKKPRVIDVSKLKAPTNITFEIDIDGQKFMSVFEVSPNTTKEEIEMARANLTDMLRKQVAEARRKTSKWLRLKRWFMSFFYTYE